MNSYFGTAFWAVLITLNTVFLLNNIVIEEHGHAAINFFAALLCWHGYFRAKNNSNEEDKE